MCLPLSRRCLSAGLLSLPPPRAAQADSEIGRYIHRRISLMSPYACTYKNKQTHIPTSYLLISGPQRNHSNGGRAPAPARLGSPVTPLTLILFWVLGSLYKVTNPKKEGALSMIWYLGYQEEQANSVRMPLVAAPALQELSNTFWGFASNDFYHEAFFHKARPV